MHDCCRLLSSLSTFADKVNISNTSLLVTRKTYAILIEDVDTNSFIGETLTIDLGSAEEVFDEENIISGMALSKKERTNSFYSERFTASVEVPPALFRDVGSDDTIQKQRISYSVFVQGSLFLSQNASQKSIIVGVRVNGTKKVAILSDPITVYFLSQQVHHKTHPLTA